MDSWDNLEGQMDIFDFLKEEPEKEVPKAPAEIWAEETGFSDYWSHDIEFIDDKPVCKYSGHTCNRKELFRLAEELNPFCPHVCCRMCSDKTCGVRCNGAATNKEFWEEWHQEHDGWHDISEKPENGQFCLFEYLWSRNQRNDSKGHCTGWWEGGKVKWLNMPFDIGHKEVVRWKAAELPKEEPEEVITKVITVDVRGLLDDGYCPKCNICLDDLVERCPECNSLLDWSHWKKLNE